MAHEAFHAWSRTTGRDFAGWSWEIYGDPSDDPSKLETSVIYLLAKRCRLSVLSFQNPSRRFEDPAVTRGWTGCIIIWLNNG